MDPMKLLRSLEEFLFEALALLFFYPVTFLRILFKPLATMRYAESEEMKDTEERYDAAVSPPLLLVLTLVLATFVGFAAHAPQPQSAGPFAKLIFDSPQYLVLFRALLFSLLPLVAAVTLLRKQKVQVSRAALRPVLFAQCYLAVPFTLFITVGGICIERGDSGALTMGLVTCAATALWMTAIQAMWFRTKLGLSMLAGILISIGVLLRAALYLIVVAVLVNWL